MSLMLDKAREYEEWAEGKILSDKRPSVHLTPRTGWLNDPNGFSYYRGQYHLFYQYHPYDTHWGPMHWGHAVSHDMIQWRYMPAALAPDQPYDKDGCFSGTAAELPDGRQLLMYTGIVWDEDEEELKAVQTQNIAAGDGLNYVKHQDNPVMTVSGLPEGYDPHEFRDPCIWQESDGSYRAVTTGFNGSLGAQFLLFASDDGIEWSFRKVLIDNSPGIGRLWECPDLFELDGVWVLLGSAIDIDPAWDGNVWEDGKTSEACCEGHNVSRCFYVTGEYDRETEEFRPEHWGLVDHGRDFYAAQTVRTPDGRRVMIGWLQEPNSAEMRDGLNDPPERYYGQMSIARELNVSDGKLLQKPVKELGYLSGSILEHTVIPSAEVTGSATGEMTREGAERIAGLGERPNRAVAVEMTGEDGKPDKTFIFDKYSLEIFEGDGSRTMSYAIYTDGHEERVKMIMQSMKR